MAEERRSGPAESRPAEDVHHDAVTTVRRLALISGHGSLASEVVARRSWAYRLISRVKAPPPAYGSRAWQALPDGDHAKVAAVVIAAECWAREGDDLPIRLALELEASRQAFKAEEDREYAERATAHREEWRGLAADRGKFMRRRQQQLDGLARKPRPGDLPGRGREGA